MFLHNYMSPAKLKILHNMINLCQQIIQKQNKTQKLTFTQIERLKCKISVQW